MRIAGFEPVDTITLHLFEQKKLKIFEWHTFCVYSANLT
jgi:hypothetical protein